MDRIGSWSGRASVPIVLGETQTPILAWALFLAGALATCVVTTQVCASSGVFFSALGHQGFGGLYAPWGFIPWLWDAGDLMNSLPLLSPTVNAEHDSSVKAAQAYMTGPVAYALLGGLGLSIVASIFATEVAKRGSKDEIKEVTDAAHFWTVDEIRAKTNFLTANCGPIIGDIVTAPEKRFGPWVIRQEKREHLRWDGQTGTNTVGVQGSGKSVELLSSLLIPQVHPEGHTWAGTERAAHPYRFPPNFVIIDTKGELRRLSSGYLKNELGYNVFIFSALSLKPGLAKFDTLHLIRMGTIHEFDDCRKAIRHVVDQGTGQKDHWHKTAIDFGAAIIGTCGYEALAKKEPWRLSHPGIVDFVTRFTKPEQLIAYMTNYIHDPHNVFGWEDEDGEPAGICPRCNGNGEVDERISCGRDQNVCYQCDGVGEMRSKKKATGRREWIVKSTNAMAAKESEESSGVYSTLQSYINEFLSAVTRLHISSSTFDMHLAATDPERKPAVLYIDMPSADLDQVRAYIRIMFQTFFSQLMNGTEGIDDRTLTKLTMDEIKTLNRLEPLAEASGNMRGHKVMVDAFWQELGQIEECYGKTQSLTNNLGVQRYYRMPPGSDAEWLSKECGETTTTIRHRNVSGHRYSVVPMGQLAENTQTLTVRNLTEYEARNIPDDEAIVFARGAQMRVKQVRYYENPELLRRSQIPPVEVSDVMVARPFFEQNLERAIGPKKYAKLSETPPNPWQEKLDAATVDDSGFRVFQAETQDKKTGAKSYFAAVWLPAAEHPVKTESFATAVLRKKFVAMCIKEYTSSDDKDANEIQLPIVEGQSPADIVADAYEQLAAQ
jgi:type IV secretory pathway TraG/TraD family ATPase VirD4